MLAHAVDDEQCPGATIADDERARVGPSRAGTGDERASIRALQLADAARAAEHLAAVDHVQAAGTAEADEQGLPVDGGPIWLVGVDHRVVVRRRWSRRCPVVAVEPVLGLRAARPRSSRSRTHDPANGPGAGEPEA